LDDLVDPRRDASVYGLRLPTLRGVLSDEGSSRRGSPQFLTPTGASRPTTETFSGIAPQRQQLQSEEGDIQAQEQGLDTRRAVVSQGSLQGSPQGSNTEHFELSPEKAGQKNIGTDDDPIFVKHDHVPDEKIVDFYNEHAANETGKKAIIQHLKQSKSDLRHIAFHIKQPEDVKRDVSVNFSEYDSTKIACFLYASFIFKYMNRDYDDIKDVDALVRDVLEYLFSKEHIDWLKNVFSIMSGSIDKSEIMEKIFKRMWNDEIDMGVIGLFGEFEAPSEGKPTHTKGISPEEGEEEEDKEVDEEVEPSKEEGEEGDEEDARS
jgi:hypothetical protein